MTDNRTTELRKNLNKLIIDIERLDITLDSPSSGMTLGEYEQEREKLLDGFMQAIAATLGSEREKQLELLVKQLWSLVNHRSGYGYAAALESIEELGIEVDE